MFKKLEILLKKSHSPITNFSVASIIIDKDNNEYEGVNVEFLTLTPTVCAERNAIQSAITSGMKVGEVKEVHILASNKTKNNSFVYPCGVCRQVISETSFNKANIFVYDLKGNVKKTNISTLLPNSFEGDVL